MTSKAVAIAFLVAAGLGGGHPLRGQESAGGPAGGGEGAGQGVEGDGGWRFVDVAEASGITFVQRCGGAAQSAIVEVKSTGAALLDVDGDGLLDLFLTAGSTIERHRQGKPGFGCRLYRNVGGMRFEDVSGPAGIPELHWACGAAAADVDSDGRDDLFVSCYGPDRLFLNRGGRMEEVSPSGLGREGWSSSAAFGDLDGDGDLDLYVARYLDFDFDDPPRHGQGWSCLWKKRPVICGPRGLPPRADGVYAGNGDGTFEEVTAAWGFAAVSPSYGLGVLIGDLAGDERPEVFVANDSAPNFLFESRGGRFADIGFLAGVSVDENGEEQAGMGVDAADLDGDGHAELVVTNFEEERNNIYARGQGGAYFDRAEAWGIGATSYSSLSWGTGIRDFNNDGILDLFVANGHVYTLADEVTTSRGYAQRNHLFVGEGAGGSLRLVERGRALGLDARRVSRGAAFGDLDNDGDIDIVVCNLNGRPGIFENRPPAGNRSLTLSLRQPGANPKAIGARVEVRCGAFSRVAEVRRNSSFQTSSDPRLHFGLGKAAPAGEARVRWPGGAIEEFPIPAGGGFHTLKRGEGRSP